MLMMTKIDDKDKADDDGDDDGDNSKDDDDYADAQCEDSQKIHAQLPARKRTQQNTQLAWCLATRAAKKRSRARGVATEPLLSDTVLATGKVAAPILGPPGCPLLFRHPRAASSRMGSPASPGLLAQQRWHAR